MIIAVSVSFLKARDSQTRPSGVVAVGCGNPASLNYFVPTFLQMAEVLLRESML